MKNLISKQMMQLVDKKKKKKKKKKKARDLQYIDAETKKQRDASNLDVPDMSVCGELLYMDSLIFSSVKLCIIY